MRVRVLFFGMLKEFAGRASDTLDIPEGSSVTDVLKHYESQIPRLKEALPSLALAVNQQYAGTDTKLRSDDEVALLPPVSGGKDGVRNRIEAAHCAIVRPVRCVSLIHGRIFPCRSASPGGRRVRAT